MLKLIKKLLPALAFMFLLQSACASELTFSDLTQMFMPEQEKTSKEQIKNSKLESNNLTNSSMKELKTVNTSKDNSQNSAQPLMTLDSFLNSQDDLLSQLEKQFQTYEFQIQMCFQQYNNLSLTNQQLETIVKTCYDKIESLQKNLEEFKKALLSNKEDTEYVNLLLGEMQLKIDQYRKYLASIETRMSRNTIVSNITIPLCAISGGIIASGVYCLINEKQTTGINLIIAGTASIIGIELVWNTGHLAFKFW